MEIPEKDSYKTISKPTEEVLFKEKNSKFYGYAYPISTEEEVKEIIESFCSCFLLQLSSLICKVIMLL